MRLLNLHKAGRIPRLPLPSLQSTLDKLIYLSSAVNDPATHTSLESAAASASLRGSTLSGLHARLASENAAPGGKFAHTSFVDPIWTLAYTGARGSIVNDVNPYFRIDESRFPGPANADSADDPAMPLRSDAITAALVIASRDWRDRAVLGPLLEEEILGKNGSDGKERREILGKNGFDGKERGEILGKNGSDGKERREILGKNGDTAGDGRDDVPLKKKKGSSAAAQELCMYQAERVFSTTRVPRAGTDYTVTHQADAGAATHIAVLCAGFPYRVEVPRDADPRRIALGFAAIREDAARRDTSPLQSLFSFSGGHRDPWATARGAIEAASGHAAFRDVDTALLVVCLDDPRDCGGAGAGSGSAIARQLLHNGARNRYFDKSIQIISCEHPDAGSVVGVNFEHTWGDGFAVVGAMNDVVPAAVEIAADMSSSSSSSSSASLSDQLFRRIDIRIPRSVADDLPAAAAAATAHAHSSSPRHVDFTAFGADAIKAAGVSPDSFLQLSYQLAYRDAAVDAGPEVPRFASVYESCNTRMFLRGRTEAIRTLTPETRAFVESLRADGGRFSRAAFDAAAGSHRAQVRACQAGAGIDRHLYALSAADSRSGGVCDPFLAHPGIAQVTRSVLSTSSLSSPWLTMFGFGAVVPEGVGTAYMVNADRIRFCIDDHPAVEGGVGGDNYARRLEGAMLELAHHLGIDSEQARE